VEHRRIRSADGLRGSVRAPTPVDYARRYAIGAGADLREQGRAGRASKRRQPPGQQRGDEFGDNCSAIIGDSHKTLSPKWLLFGGLDGISTRDLWFDSPQRRRARRIAEVAEPTYFSHRFRMRPEVRSEGV